MEAEQIAKGERAEEVTGWYFRLNGFFLLPSFVVHKDSCSDYPRTEADFLAVRLRHSAEYLKGERLIDDPVVQDMAKVEGLVRDLAVLVEVKSSECRINGPWSNPADRNMHYAIRRMGFVDPNQIDMIADTMYEHLRWEGKKWVMQYVCVGRRESAALSGREKLVQITFDTVGEFLYWRFLDFPEKIPLVAGILQWPGFGKDYAYWSESARRRNEFNPASSQQAVWKYIETGKFS